MDGYLAEFGGDLDDEQRRTLGLVLDKVAERWPGPDYTEERTEAGSAATMIVFGDSTDAEFLARWQRARAAERDARAALTGAMVLASVRGESEAGIAARLGVSRTTVRKALAKSGRTR